MAISFENAFGTHDSALLLSSRRAEVISRNLANSETPGFKARDIDFRAILNAESEGRSSTFQMARTNKSHMPMSNVGFGAQDDLKYRVPTQDTVNGNTVEEHVEHAEYAKNALRFQSEFTFLNGRVRGLINAIKGE
ncbi:MAG: flagellar basal body rod protein FlgB [Pseudomonadales bacterium]|jgi:flagellar basal-body rod protein FlgB|nr:flagellar basal body rod protein FlgB [Pseudomonadales bacterium]